MIAEPRTRMTVEEFLALPETNRIVQLIDGEVIELASPIPDHQEAAGDVFVVFKERAKRLGGRVFQAPMDVVIEPESLTVVQPDVFWIAPNSPCLVTPKHVVGVPELVVEVLSPTTERLDRRVKFRLYERVGVREYWLVNPEVQLVEVWMLIDGRFQLLDAYGADETFQSALLGEIAVSEIFPVTGGRSA